ncbi:MAG: hypothetical protein Q9219_001050 [cf. Caloplaca sp. 3 TL-2023]
MGGENSQEVRLAAAALGIAFAALTIAVTQLLGQFFATADGYRRCQPSVMGAWAKYTRLRWKWSEMRFETLFTVPKIVLLEHVATNSSSPIKIPRQELKWIGNFPGSTPMDNFVSHEKYGNSDIEILEEQLLHQSLETGTHHELACWIPFMASIRYLEDRLQSRLRRPDGYEGSTPFYTPHRSAINLVQTSWDFMAPDIVRPLAETSVGDIAIIVERLGMKWQAFRPEYGEMRAEGNDQMIYSTLDRSTGTILHYAQGAKRHGLPMNFYGEFKSDSHLAEVPTIPTRESDMMRFGILPCHKELMGREFYTMGTIEEVKATLNLLDPTGSASKKVHDNRTIEATSTYGFPDLIAMAAPILRKRGDANFRLPVPTEHCIGLTSLMEGFYVFRERLDDFVHGENSQPSERIQWVLDCWDALLRKHMLLWPEGVDPSRRENGDVWLVTFLDEVNDAWDYTTDYFRELAKSNFHVRYADIVACHMKHAVHFWHEAHGRVKRQEARNHWGLCDWLEEGMHLYWDFLPAFVEELSESTSAPKSLMREAWIVLMFRAFCWSRCHYMCRSDERFPELARIPSRYWNSKLPVYLG